MRFSLFTFFSVSRHMPGPKVCVSHYSRFSVFLAIFQVLQCVLFIFHVFQCFFFAIFQVLQCPFLFFHVFQFSRYIPGPMLCISHFPPSSLFLAIFHVQQCVCLIFYVFQFSLHIPDHRLCISHFPRFSVFLAIFQVLQCALLIFHVFQCFYPYSMSYHVRFSFS